MQAELYIEAVRAAMRLNPISVVVLRNIGRIPFVDVELIRGAEVEMPRWLAEILEARGLVEVRRDIRGSSDVNKIRFSEEDLARRSSASLSKVPLDFYISVERLLRDLGERVRRGGSPEDLRELEAISRSINRLLSIRVQKILLASILHTERSQDFEKSLSIEEKVLYRLVDDDVKYWLRRAVGGVYGGSG